LVRGRIVSMALQVYTNDDGMTIRPLGSPYFTKDVHLNAEELDVLERFAADFDKNHRPPVPTRPHEIAQIFPEGKTYLLERKKAISSELGGLLESERKINERFSQHKDKPTREKMLTAVKERREDLLYEQASNDEMLGFMGGGKRAKKAMDFQRAIEVAKSYPIDRLLQFRHGKGVCLWHTDKNPSMHYYKKNNKVYCFACNQGGDAIDVAMKMRNCDFNGAVAFLTNT
jgi:hypothetical protein